MFLRLQCKSYIYKPIQFVKKNISLYKKNLIKHYSIISFLFLLVCFQRIFLYIISLLIYFLKFYSFFVVFSLKKKGKTKIQKKQRAHKCNPPSISLQQRPHTHWWLLPNSPSLISYSSQFSEIIRTGLPSRKV